MRYLNAEEDATHGDLAAEVVVLAPFFGGERLFAKLAHDLGLDRHLPEIVRLPFGPPQHLAMAPPKCLQSACAIVRVRWCDVCVAMQARVYQVEVLDHHVLAGDLGHDL